jgi:hypothetical protein
MAQQRLTQQQGRLLSAHRRCSMSYASQHGTQHHNAAYVLSEEKVYQRCAHIGCRVAAVLAPQCVPGTVSADCTVPRQMCKAVHQRMVKVPLYTGLQSAGTSHCTTERSSCQADLATGCSARRTCLSAPGITCVWHCHLQFLRYTVHGSVAERNDSLHVITGGVYTRQAFRLTQESAHRSRPLSMMWWATHSAPSNSQSASPIIQRRKQCLPGSPSCENSARAPALWRTTCPLVRLLRACSHVSCWTGLCRSWPIHLSSHG